jgi:hypothetical protein
MEQRSPHPKRRWDRLTRLAATVTLASMVALGGLGWWQRDALFGTTTEPGTPAPAAPDLTAEETAFYEYVAPRLRELVAQSQELAALGRSKSRNLIELQRRGGRVDDLSRQIDDFVSAAGVPARFVSAKEDYATGIVAVRRAKEESRSAFVTFDWERVARAIEVMETGADKLVSAMQELERVAGVSAAASPTAGA